jgi:hypothetical protein
MRKKYDFSKGTRGPFRTTGPRRNRGASVGRAADHSGQVDEELTPAQIRDLRRRVADLDDETRYMLVSQMGPRFALYYNVSDDVYVMDDPRGATLFKRRKAALAVRALLGGSIHVVRCKSKRISGVRVPVLSAKRQSRRPRADRWSSNQGLQPTAGAKRRFQGPRRSAGRG